MTIITDTVRTTATTLSMRMGPILITTGRDDYNYDSRVHGRPPVLARITAGASSKQLNTGSDDVLHITSCPALLRSVTGEDRSGA